MVEAAFNPKEFISVKASVHNVECEQSFG